MKKPAEQNRAEVPEYIAAGVLGPLTLLLPAKFASLAVMPEAASFFPGYWSTYIELHGRRTASGWPSGFSLLLALFVYGFRAPQPQRSPAGRTALLWAFGLPLAVLPGLINCNTFDYGVWELFLLAGIGAYGRFLLVLFCRPEWRMAYVWLLIAGAAYAVYAGLRQYFVGFAEMQEFTRQQYEARVSSSAASCGASSKTTVFSASSPPAMCWRAIWFCCCHWPAGGSGPRESNSNP